MKGYLSDRTKISILTTTTLGAAGTSTITSSALNMAGFDGVLFLVPLGTIVSGAVTSLKIQQSSDDGSSDDYTDVAGTAQTIADTDDDKCLYVDMQRPGKQYLKLIVSRATQNATIGGIFAIQYQKRSLGTASHGSNVAGEQWLTPAEGTA
jgi:hypothetical protein